MYTFEYHVFCVQSSALTIRSFIADRLGTILLRRIEGIFVIIQYLKTLGKTFV